MNIEKGKLKTCNRGHTFYKSSDCPVCPICWPNYRKKMQGDLPVDLAAPALRALSFASIKKLAQLTRYTKEDLLQLHGFGPRALKVLERALDSKGLALKK